MSNEAIRRATRTDWGMRERPYPFIGLLSHILPPSPTGQATVLYRLLNGFPSERYRLISRAKYDGTEPDMEATEKLPAKYYYLRPAFQLPILSVSTKLSIPCIAINTMIGVYLRASQLKRIIRREKFDLLIVCTGDLYDLPAAYLAGRWTRLPFVPYIFDDYAYQWTGLYRSFSERLEPVILRRAKGVIVTNEYMQQEYVHRYGIHSTVIHNPCPMPSLENLDRAERIFNRDQINIVYAGAIYHAHYDAFRNLIAAIGRLERFDTRLHLYTFQPESELKRNGISGNMVVYHRHMSHLEVPKVLRQADILFLPLAFESPIPEVIRTSAPGKLAEYLSVGRPVLVHAPRDSFVSWFFREHRCGVVVDKDNPQVLSEEMDRIVSQREIEMEICANARAVAESEFGIDVMKRKFRELIEDLTRERQQIDS